MDASRKITRGQLAQTSWVTGHVNRCFGNSQDPHVSCSDKSDRRFRVSGVPSLPPCFRNSGFHARLRRVARVDGILISVATRGERRAVDKDDHRLGTRLATRKPPREFSQRSVSNLVRASESRLWRAQRGRRARTHL